MRDRPFIFNFPQKLVGPIVLSAPHGGRKFSRSLLDHTQLSQGQLLATSDLHTDVMVSHSDDWPWITAEFARVVVDLNRSPSMLDFAVVDGVPKHQSPYVRAGYGVIPRFAERGQLLRNEKISQAEADEILRSYYFPYHEQLGLMLDRVKRAFGEVILLDIHSAPRGSMRSADIVLGTDFGRSIAMPKRAMIQDILQSHFQTVIVDNPFSGGFITQKYGDARGQIHVLQIEVNRDLVEDQNRELCQDFFKKWCVVLDEISQIAGRASKIPFAAE